MIDVTEKSEVFSVLGFSLCKMSLLIFSDIKKFDQCRFAKRNRYCSIFDVV